MPHMKFRIPARSIGFVWPLPAGRAGRNGFASRRRTVRFCYSGHITTLTGSSAIDPSAEYCSVIVYILRLGHGAAKVLILDSHVHLVRVTGHVQNGRPASTDRDRKALSTSMIRRRALQAMHELCHVAYRPVFAVRKSSCSRITALGHRRDHRCAHRLAAW